MIEILGQHALYQPVAAEQYRTVLTGIGMDEATAAFPTALEENMADGIVADDGVDPIPPPSILGQRRGEAVPQAEGAQCRRLKPRPRVIAAEAGAGWWFRPGFMRW